MIKLYPGTPVGIINNSLLELRVIPNDSEGYNGLIEFYFKTTHNRISNPIWGSAGTVQCFIEGLKLEAETAQRLQAIERALVELGASKEAVPPQTS